jgi:hypothetical protein
MREHKQDIVKVEHDAGESSDSSTTTTTTSSQSNAGGLRERKAYIILVVMCIFLSVIALFGGIYESDVIVKNNNLKFCRLLDSAVATPIPKPADPKSNPSRVHAYQGYERALKLDHDLGCSGYLKG